MESQFTVDNNSNHTIKNMSNALTNNIINYQLLAIYKIFPTVFSIFVKLSQKCLDLVCKTKNKTLV